MSSCTYLECGIPFRHKRPLAWLLIAVLEFWSFTIAPTPLSCTCCGRGFNARVLGVFRSRLTLASKARVREATLSRLVRVIASRLTELLLVNGREMFRPIITFNERHKFFQRLRDVLRKEHIPWSVQVSMTWHVSQVA